MQRSGFFHPPLSVRGNRWGATPYFAFSDVPPPSPHHHHHHSTDGTVTSHTCRLEQLTEAGKADDDEPQTFPPMSTLVAAEFLNENTRGENKRLSQTAPLLGNTHLMVACASTLRSVGDFEFSNRHASTCISMMRQSRHVKLMDRLLIQSYCRFLAATLSCRLLVGWKFYVRRCCSQAMVLWL